MKKILLAILLPIVLTSSLLAQSYWFGGMTRVPDGNSGGTKSAFNLGTQDFSQNITKLSQKNNSSGSVVDQNFDSDNSLVGYSAFQLGFEGAMTNTFFDLEAGVDLGFASLSSDITNDDEAFLGANLRLGGVLKYSFTPQDDLMITPFLRSGFSLEFVTNDLSLPTSTYYYTPAGYVPSYNYGNAYSDVYGTSLVNTFFNISIGTSLKWNNFTAGVALGKYMPMGGDLADFYDMIPGLDAPDPLFLKLNVGYAFSETFSLDFGWRAEWYDQSISSTFDYLGTSYTETLDIEWEGHAFDLTFNKSF